MPIGYKKQRLHLQSLFLCWHRAIFPVRRQTSIFATDELNFRVRNGNGWTLVVIDTNFVEIRFARSVSASSLRLSAKTAYRFAVSSLQNETSFHFGLRGNEVKLSGMERKRRLRDSSVLRTI